MIFPYISNTLAEYRNQTRMSLSGLKKRFTSRTASWKSSLCFYLSISNIYICVCKYIYIHSRAFPFAGF